jgi:hypothetical protein
MYQKISGTFIRFKINPLFINPLGKIRTMKTSEKLLIATVFLIGLSSVSYCQEQGKAPLKARAGFMTGYNRGFGLQANLTLDNFPGGFPFELRFGMGYTLLNPGNAADARRIFINNATNGEPEKRGGSFDMRLDFLKPGQFFGIGHSFFVFGPRFSTFKGHFDYVGGNEVFDVTSHQWGIGAGFEHHFSMSQNVSFIIGYGLDFYVPGKLTGHDTSYSPGNDNVNAENNNQNNDLPFQYRDANKAIHQPEFIPHIMMGVNFNL